MSTLLGAIIKERRDNAISYEEYLKKIAAIAQKLHVGYEATTPKTLKSPAQRALYNNLEQNEKLALTLHDCILEYKPNGWRGIDTREKVVKKAIYSVLNNFEDTERIFDIVKKQAEY